MENWQKKWHQFVAEGFFDNLPPLDDPLSEPPLPDHLLTGREGLIHRYVGYFRWKSFNSR